MRPSHPRQREVRVHLEFGGDVRQVDKAKRSVHEPSHKTLESVNSIGYYQGNAGDKSSRGGLLTPIGEIASFSMFWLKGHFVRKYGVSR